MGRLLIILSVFFLLWLLLRYLWPVILRWLGNMAARRMEDAIRKSAGLPPRGKEKKSTRGSSQRQQTSSGRSSRGYYSSRRAYYDDGPIIPREYAEDVDFVEIKEFSSSSESVESDSGDFSEYHEEQISDAVWEMVKPDKKRK